MNRSTARLSALGVLAALLCLTPEVSWAKGVEWEELNLKQALSRAKAEKALVPSLILQPLIENAIKYAITPSEDGGTLTIAARVQQDTLMLTLSDTGPGLGNGNGEQKSSGVGLKNTRERLLQLYGDRQAFTLAPNEPTGLTVTINLPYEVDDAERSDS